MAMFILQTSRPNLVQYPHTKDKLFQIYPPPLVQQHIRYCVPRRGRFWALRGATACHGHGAEIRSTKSCDAAEWLAIQNNSSCKRSDSDQQLQPRHHTNPISPPRERDA